MNCIAIVTHRLTPALEFTVKKTAANSKNIILIHVDKKVNIAPFLHLSRSNVIFLENRIECIWGNISQVDVTLLLLKESLKYNFDYFHLISGDDILLQSADFEGFDQNNRKQYIAFQDNDSQPINPEKRVVFKYPSVFFKKSHSFFEKVFKKLFLIVIDIRYKLRLYKPSPLPLRKGTNWFSLTKDCIEMIDSFVEDNKNYRIFFKHSLCGDEVFFHSIIYNSKYRDSIYKHTHTLSIGSIAEHALRYIDWKNGPDFPRTLTKEDFKKIKGSGMLFCRKMSPNISENELNFFK